MNTKAFRRQKPVSMVLSTEIRKNINLAGLVKANSLKRRDSIISPNAADFDFNDPKAFDVKLMI